MEFAETGGGGGGCLQLTVLDDMLHRVLHEENTKLFSQALTTTRFFPLAKPTRFIIPLSSAATRLAEQMRLWTPSCELSTPVTV
jgi:hypothetical protein